MRPTPCLLLAPALLAGCHPDRPSSDRGKSVRIAVDGEGEADGGRVSVEIPGVDAKLALPGLNLARHVDLDGIQLAPGTHVKTIDVGDRAERGRVLLAFTNPGAASPLLDHYRRSAERAGYRVIASGPTALSAQKGGKRFAVTLVTGGGDTRGTIALGDGA